MLSFNFNSIAFHHSLHVYCWSKKLILLHKCPYSYSITSKLIIPSMINKISEIKIYVLLVVVPNAFVLASYNIKLVLFILDHNVFSQNTYKAVSYILPSMQASGFSIGFLFIKDCLTALICFQIEL